MIYFCFTLVPQTGACRDYQYTTNPEDADSSDDSDDLPAVTFLCAKKPKKW